MKAEHRRSIYKRLYSKNKRNIFCAPKDKLFYIKASLYLSIAVLLLISSLFIRSAVDLTESNPKIAFQSSASISDASGEDSPGFNIDGPKIILSQEIPLIYGVDIQTDTGDNTDEIQKGTNDQNNSDIYFDVLPEDIKMEILKISNEKPGQFSISSQGPQILIYHTHTEEAYRQIAGEEYAESGDSRTKDQNNSVVAVGEALKNALEGYGFNVLHDTTDHEPPSLTTAYSRSLTTMEKYAKQYPDLRVYIDLHRDAYGDIDAGRKDYITVNGDECARVMFVVGTGQGYTGTGFDGKPNYESNYKLALAITNQLESIKKGFTRPIRVKTGRYNQQVSDMCLLIEVGHNANSLQQAINSAKYIAQAINKVISIEKQ